MARWDLIINYGTVRDIANAAKSLAGGIDDVKTQIKGVNGAVANCAGAAITALEEKTPELESSLDKLKGGLNSLSDVFNEFADSMLGIINFGEGGLNNVVHVNTENVQRKLKKMINELDDFSSYSSRLNPSISGNFFASIVELTDSDKARLNNINKQINNMAEKMQAVGNYVIQFEDDFEKMRQELERYEDNDDAMKSKIKAIYNDLADIDWWETTTFKVIVGATLVIAAIAVIVIVPAGAVGFAAFALGTAKSVIAYGALNTTIGAISAYFSGDDIEDAVATGLFEGTIEGILVGGSAEAGKMLGQAFVKSNMGHKLVSKASKTEIGQNIIANISKTEKGRKILDNITDLNKNKKNIEEFFKFNVEYGGHIANTTFKTMYKGKEVDLGEIARTEAIKHSWKAIDKVAMRDINKIFDAKAKEIMDSTKDISQLSDMAVKGLVNDFQRKISQYSAKSGIYFAQLAGDAAYEERISAASNYEDFSLSDAYDSFGESYDGVKLLKYIIKDDFKDVVKEQVVKYLGNNAKQ